MCESNRLPSGAVDGTSYGVRCEVRAAVAAAVFVLLFTGCATIGVSLPAEVKIAELEPSGHAARPLNCSMPVLNADPLTAFRKVAIIEGIGNVFEEDAAVEKAVREKACETGADAIIVHTRKRQTSEAITGYYINAIAIVYEPEGDNAAARRADSQRR
ncbi:MAG: hypothetical protein ACREQB_07800 [Candidatus Binataceae bacterium]